jgi:hypothetical protein
VLGDLGLVNTENAVGDEEQARRGFERVCQVIRCLVDEEVVAAGVWRVTLSALILQIAPPHRIAPTSPSPTWLPLLLFQACPDKDSSRLLLCPLHQQRNRRDIGVERPRDLSTNGSDLQCTRVCRRAISRVAIVFRRLILVSSIVIQLSEHVQFARTVAKSCQNTLLPGP